MPFVTDIVGPQRPVQSWPALTAGVLRRTATIDTHPGKTGESFVDLRARDAGTERVFDEVAVRAHLTDRVIDEIDGGLEKLVGSRVGPGFRSTVGRLVPDEVERFSLLHLLLDDWVGAALVSGYAVQHAAINLGIEQKLGPGVADNMAGVCAGFAADASLVPYAKRNGTIPSVHGPIAPSLGSEMHTVEPLRPHGMRRLRRLDLGADDAFSAHFRDSHVDGDGVETIVHEYTVEGTLDPVRRTITSVDATVHVLPWQECPNAIASAARVAGMSLSDMRARIRTEFVGTSTCTHLNDTLRELADLDALLDLRAR
jgi:hypothetical protein